MDNNTEVLKHYLKESDNTVHRCFYCEREISPHQVVCFRHEFILAWEILCLLFLTIRILLWDCSTKRRDYDDVWYEYLWKTRHKANKTH